MVQKLENVVIMSLEEYAVIEERLSKVTILENVKDKNLFQDKIDYAQKSLEGVDLSKELSKECIKVGINSDNHEAIKSLLEMYGQKISNSTLRRLSSSEFVNQITCIWFDGDIWVSSDEMIDSELLVDLDYLKSILEKENTIFSDKFAELKEAHKNGAVIEYYNKLLKEWQVCKNFIWDENYEYRIKPEEKSGVEEFVNALCNLSDTISGKPKVGDIVKAWDNDESNFVIGVLSRIDEYWRLKGFEYGFNRAKVITPQQMQELFFGKGSNNA